MQFDGKMAKADINADIHKILNVGKFELSVSVRLVNRIQYKGAGI